MQSETNVQPLHIVPAEVPSSKYNANSPQGIQPNLQQKPTINKPQYEEKHGFLNDFNNYKPTLPFGKGEDQYPKDPNQRKQSLLSRMLAQDAGTVDEEVEVEEMAATVQKETGRENRFIPTMEHKPFDENLVCPKCGKQHRVGEIQKFSWHVKQCNEKDD